MTHLTHTRSLVTLLLFGLASVLFAAPVKFDIPAQPASAALQLFIKQSGTEVLFVQSELTDVQANAVSGEFESSAALDALLQNTGFVVRQNGRSKFSIARASASRPGAIEGEIREEKSGRPVANAKVQVAGTDKLTTTDRRGRFLIEGVPAGNHNLLVVAEGMQNTKVTDVELNAGSQLSLSPISIPVAVAGTLQLEVFSVRAKKNDGVIELDPYAVTGAKQQPFSDRNVDLPRTINDVQPYYIFNSQTIEESGTTSVEDFLRQRLTMNTTVRTNSQLTLYGSQFGANGAGVNANTTSSVNLNGLGSDHTLILVNGLPLAGVAINQGGGFAVTTPGQPDVNGIPLSAIDHIEVLPSSAGAIYGASAVGGVINIILKKAYTGGDISATYASTWDGHGASHTIEATFGKSFNRGKTQLFFTAQYSDSAPLFVKDRLNLYIRGFQAILARDPGFFSYFGPADISSSFLGSEPNFNNASISGGILTFKGTGASFGSSYGTVPVGFSNTSDPQTLIAGQWNFTPPDSDTGPSGLRVPLGNYPRRKSIMGTLTHEFTSKLQIHFDYSYNENHSYSVLNPFSSGIFLRAESPINPFNQSIDITVPLNYPAPATSNSINNAITAGGTLKLPYDWVAHMDYQWSQSTFEYAQVYSLFNTASRTATFSATNPNTPPLWNGAFNPLTDLLAHPVDMDQFAAFNRGASKSITNDLIMAASGPLAHLPWGEPKLSVRLEHNETEQPNGNHNDFGPLTTPYPGLPDASSYRYVSYAQSQTIDSANAEIDFPVFKTELPLLRALDLQFNVGVQQSTVDVGTPGYLVVDPYPYNTGAAGRINGPAGTYLLGPNTLSRFGNNSIASGAQPYRQKARISGHSITGPALSYRPFADLLLRASVASGYVPPTYAQLLPTNYLQAPSTTSITDPKNGGSRYNITSYSLGGNPDLNPTTSKSWDFGLVWQPTKGLFRGLRVDAEYVETKQFNQILDPGIQQFINLESLFPSQIMRDPATGLITTVYDKFINVAESKQSALTYTVDYTWRTVVGSFDLSAAETIQEHNQRQIVAATPFLEYVGFPSSGGVAKTKATASLRWSHRNWVAGWTVVSFGGYYQQGAAGDPGQYATQLQTGVPYTLNTRYTAAQGSDTVPSQTYHNLYLSYSFRKGMFDSRSKLSRLCDSILDGVKVSLVVNNVFNTLPSLDAYYFPFYASPYGDVQLRNYSITLKKSF